MLYEVLGWLNIFFFVVMTSPFWIRIINDHTFHWKGAAYKKTIRILRKIHKPLGFVILVIAGIHGYLALGAIRLPTGSLIAIATMLTAALGIAFYFSKKKTLFKLHRWSVLLILILVALHLLFPSALWYLFHI